MEQEPDLTSNEAVMTLQEAGLCAKASRENVLLVGGTSQIDVGGIVVFETPFSVFLTEDGDLLAVRSSGGNGAEEYQAKTLRAAVSWIIDRNRDAQASAMVAFGPEIWREKRRLRME